MTTVSYFALIYASTLWLSRFLLRYMEPEMFLDQPTERKLHTEAKPRFGGIAFGSAIIVVGWFIMNDHMQFTWYFLAGITMFLLGAIDDYWSISWRLKLPTQIMTAFLIWVQFIKAVPLISFFGISLTDNPFIIGALFIFWFVGIVNAVNLIDGMDGLAGGYIFLTSFFALVIGWVSGNKEFIYFNTIFMGAMAAFLHFNQRPAKFFMGDSGSLLLGYHVAVLPLLFFATTPSISNLNITPFILLSSYLIIDTARVFYDRLRKRLHPLEPDQNHLHHLLYNETGSYKGTLLTIFIYLSIFGVMAIISLTSSPGIIAMTCYLILTIALILVTKLTDFGLVLVNRVIERFSWDEDHLPGYQMLIRIRFLPILSLLYFISIIIISTFGQDWSTAAPLLIFSLILIIIFSFRGSIFPHNMEILLIAVGIVQIYLLNSLERFPLAELDSSIPQLIEIIRYAVLGLITVITTVNYIARSKSLGPDFWKISDLLIFFILVGMASLQPLGIGISPTMAAELGILYLANKLGLPRMLSFFAAMRSGDTSTPIHVK
ncbi:MAG: undecaprenyl/decaprenyl-phosphate alpha-N-acetylglucosaminyl 1-phosphate transferase [Candidatus Marinimicrobia bacterium]|nr:undecaprenyl/decaprenyl-phosphate alpha-N-acetylglucosaminyl 1-phosphate transferase [Candidatus Neomarinimicrobiota bacterium]